MNLRLNPTLKHALISILVGAGIAFATSLLQGLLHLVNADILNVTGSGAGMLWYLNPWRTNQPA